MPIHGISCHILLNYDNGVHSDIGLVILDRHDKVGAVHQQLVGSDGSETMSSSPMILTPRSFIEGGLVHQWPIN